MRTLNDLLEGESKAAYLTKMIQQQQEKLVAIFRRIHVPNEFTDVQLNGELYMRRRSGVRASFIPDQQRSEIRPRVVYFPHNERKRRPKRPLVDL